MSTRVLVADALSDTAIEDLRAAGLEVEVQTDLTADSLPDAIRGFKVLIVRSTKVTRATIDAADRLALIVRAGSGTNTIDVESASRRGIFVSNCPGKNSVAVAELAIGLMLALDRRIPDNTAELRAGRWNKKEFSKARGIKGSRLGLVGFGSIAREVASRARAFGMKVTAYSRSLTKDHAEAAGVERATSLQQLFRNSDVVSVHLPLTAETRGIVGKELIALMPPGAMLINTARAEVVDSDAVLAAAREKRIRVGTDVYASEPEGGKGDFADVLGKLEGVVGTHHIGASTEQAQNEIAAQTVRIVRTFVETGEVVSAVNVLDRPPAAGTLVVRHLDRVGVLASVLTALKAANINVENMENVIFDGREAACARIKVTEWPAKGVLEEIRGLEHVLHAEIV